ncbi:hypothetical protein V7S43_003552 [Phytophthora oleae]|uniref:Uncharacterized protein n=1 Tax=Phytophthora oleae TaxID=2107226 RepID=A0ABD3FZK8_9STRA
MRKPDWNTNEKTALYNKLRQMRLAMIQTHATSLATIDAQKKLRTKYSSDLRKAQESIHKLEEIKTNTVPNTRKMTTEQLCVDSDAFDSFSKQMIDVETLVPNLRTRLEKTNATIVTEKKNIKLIREYVRDFAVRKLQTTIRAFFRFRRWKSVMKAFHEDVCWSAAVEIQAIWRMFTAKKQRFFLLQLRYNQAKAKAACVIKRFFTKVIEAKRRRKLVFTKDADTVFATRKQKVLDTLFAIFGHCVLHEALVRWKKKTYKIRIRTLEKIVASVILIQRIYRGFRVRTYLKRIKIRSSLTDRVGTLVDQFIVSGDFWSFVLAIDADYRRFSHKIAQEEADATTFMSTVLRQRKLDEDQMMQDWFTASALDNPVVAGIDHVTKTYSTEERHSSMSSVSQAMLHSSLVDDLVALSPNKKKDDLFPAEFPATVIRQAMAKGFLRGLQAQRKEIGDTELVLSTLQKRTPLMTNPWTSERVLREARGGDKAKISTRKPISKTRPNLFISENLLDSIPGGMNAPIARLLLVAALRCYDPGSRNEKGTFVPCEGRNSQLFQTYLRTESPLLKIRSEQQAMEVVKPYLHTLLENRCYTAYDILYNVRGIGELVSWNIPGPLAASIYSVIQEIHVQSAHISKRNIIKEVRISAGFEQFLKTRGEKIELSNASNPSEVPVESPITPLKDSVSIQVQSRLETDVLGLPLHDISMPASELLFKAAFLVCGDSDNTATDTYQRFLHSLMTLQTSGDTEAMKQRIAARVTQAKSIADGHTDAFQLFGVRTADDLMVRNFLFFQNTHRTHHLPCVKPAQQSC